MPELPEVETVRRSLEAQTLGRRITQVCVLWARSIATPSKEQFIERLQGSRLVHCGRRAKYLVFSLDCGQQLITHLRMSGDLKCCASTALPEKHLRVRMSLDDGNELRFIDTRKFGKMYLVDSAEELLKDLGPEPLESEFSEDRLQHILRSSGRAIKTVLLDQRMIAGLGNIYATEALWHACIHPLTPAKRIKAPEVIRLHHAIQDVLRRAVADGGTDLGDGVWLRGGFETFAYGLAAKPCRRCSTPLKLLVIGQRRTDYCPVCQTRQRHRGTAPHTDKI